MWLEEILDSVNKLTWLLSLSALCGILIHQVRLIYKAVFNNEGEVKFVSKRDNLAQLAKQNEKNKEMEASLKETRHEKCPWHDDAMQLPIDLKTQQQMNMLRLGRLEHDAEDSRREKEEMHKKLTQICINTGAIMAEQKSMAEDIKELKERRISERGL